MCPQLSWRFLSTFHSLRQVVGKVSPWINTDSESPALQCDSVAALRQELHWAAHLSLQACLLPAPPCPLQAANYARILCEVRAKSVHLASVLSRLCQLPRFTITRCSRLWMVRCHEYPALSLRELSQSPSFTPCATNRVHPFVLQNPGKPAPFHRLCV